MNIEDIWSEFRTGLKAFLHSRISNTADVDDLLQEILIKTHNNIHTIKSDSSIKSWLYQIANNAITDFYRKKAKHRDLKSEELWYQEDDKNVFNDLEQCITPFISRLPTEDSELLTAIDIHGQSQKNYAELNNIKYSTLKSRVLKSRKMLRKIFEECCEFSIDKFGNIMSCKDKTGKYTNC